MAVIPSWITRIEDSAERAKALGVWGDYHSSVEIANAVCHREQDESEAKADRACKVAKTRYEREKAPFIEVAQ